EERTRLDSEKQRIEKRLAVLRDRHQHLPSFAETFLRHLKIEQALHQTFGGRVFFHQFGSEALDARRQLFEQAEKEGDLKFTDAGVRHMLYYYANMKHVTVDAETLEKAGFLKVDK